jgi:hypothetical protein
MQIRVDLIEAQSRAWQQIAHPGTWWTGAERVAIAAEMRNAGKCQLCADRRSALSPTAYSGAHDSLGALPVPVVEAIHRIRTDSGRLGESRFRGLLANGLPEGHYVELISIVAVVVAIDTFRYAAGLQPWNLPEPRNGLPSFRRPIGAKPGLAWVATLAPEDRSEADPDLYGDAPGPRRRTGANIHRALSLVPDAMLHWWDMFEAMYQTSAQMRDFSREPRAVTHAQMEMLAARVAALNRCEY